MGLRQSTPRYNNSRVERVIAPRRNYMPVSPPRLVEEPDTMGNVVGQKSTPVQPVEPLYYDPNPCGEYVDVVGSDSGNLTVFSWITQLGTCCASLCTLIVLIAFVVWMFLNRSINALP